jgi:hypothetical protein
MKPLREESEIGDANTLPLHADTIFYCDECGEELKNFICLNKDCKLYLEEEIYSN